MKCPSCSFENIDDAPFCEKCGHVFLSSDRIPEVPDPTELERRRDAALTGVPAVLNVPDVVPPAPAPRPSVADMAEPWPEAPAEPDFSGFERLVDSSYVPPAADTHAGDTAEIPVIRDEYVPRARNYVSGLSERELRKRDRQQRRMAKKFEKQQAKEAKRAARLAAKKEAAARRDADRVTGEDAAAERERVQETVMLDENGLIAQDTPASAAAEAAAALVGAGAVGMLSEEEVRAWKEGLGEGPLALGSASLDSVMLTGDGVVSLFEKRSQQLKHRVAAAHNAAAPEAAETRELPKAEQGLAVRGEVGIESAEGGRGAAGADATSALAPLGAEAAAGDGTGTSELPAVRETAPAAPEPPASPARASSSHKASSASAAPAPNAPAEKGAAKEARASAERNPTAAPSTVPPAPCARPRRPKVVIVLAAVLAVALIGAAAAVGTYMAELWGGKTVPQVVGLSKDEAIAKLAEKGFGAEVAEVVSDDPAGTVLSASPEQGQRAEEGSTVALSVAVPRLIPTVVGLTQQEAADALAAAGYTAVEVAQQKSNEAEGTVLAVSPEEGAEAHAGDTVTLTVAIPFTVPDVAGLGKDDAQAKLEAEGYAVQTQRYYTEDVDEGTAVGTDPEAGTQLPSGSEVKLLIAKSRAAELRDLTASILPGAILKTDDGSYKVEKVLSTSWHGYTEDGGGQVDYKVEATKFEVVDLPFGLGQQTYYDSKTTELEGGIVWNDDDKVTYASPSIKY